jgi:serine/threonine-protein kinase
MVVEGGARIGDKLEFIRKLSQGASGEVWLARHLGLDSRLAVKLLHGDVERDPTARQRFLREAKALARLRSPYIVQVFDYGLHDDQAYLAMEYLVGETLDDRLQKIERLSVPDAARICTQIAKALQAAHGAGVVHRDVKPANVFLVTYGDEEIAKVVDFGIQKSSGSMLESSRTSTLTRAGSMLGTPYYMSPEQMLDSGSVDHRTDLWALGVIAYECLTGRLPFEGSNLPNLILAISSGPIPVPSRVADVPPGFDAWFARAVARNPEERFESAKVMATDLCRALLAGSLVELPLMDAASGSFPLPSDLLWSSTNPTISTDPEASGSVLQDEASVNQSQASLAGHVSALSVSRRPQRRRSSIALLGIAATAVAAGGVTYSLTRQPARLPPETVFSAATSLSQGPSEGKDLPAAPRGSAPNDAGPGASSSGTEPQRTKSVPAPPPQPPSGAQNLPSLASTGMPSPTLEPITPRNPFGDRY